MQRQAAPFLGIHTFTMHDLRERYHNCAASTIYRRIKYEGYPRQSRIGRENLWNARAVYEWEREHMPELHNVKVTAVDATEDDELTWKRLQEQVAPPSRRQADQAERKAENQRWRALRDKVQGKPRAARRARAGK